MFWLHNIFVRSRGWIWHRDPLDPICYFVHLFYQSFLFFGALVNPIIMFAPSLKHTLRFKFSENIEEKFGIMLTKHYVCRA